MKRRGLAVLPAGPSADLSAIAEVPEAKEDLSAEAPASSEEAEAKEEAPAEEEAAEETVAEQAPAEVEEPVLAATWFMPLAWATSMDWWMEAMNAAQE